jgi:hypothetical protein
MQNILIERRPRRMEIEEPGRSGSLACKGAFFHAMALAIAQDHCAFQKVRRIFCLICSHVIVLADFDHWRWRA